MKTIRWFMVLLMAWLLPLTGVVAFSMPCHGEAHGHSQANDGGHGSAHDTGQGHPAQAASASRCQTCAALCCLVALPEALPTHTPSIVARSEAFPAWSARVARFTSDGQERPPRST